MEFFLSVWKRPRQHRRDPREIEKSHNASAIVEEKDRRKLRRAAELFLDKFSLSWDEGWIEKESRLARVKRKIEEVFKSQNRT